MRTSEMGQRKQTKFGLQYVSCVVCAFFEVEIMFASFLVLYCISICQTKWIEVYAYMSSHILRETMPLLSPKYTSRTTRLHAYHVTRSSMYKRIDDGHLLYCHGCVVERWYIVDGDVLSSYDISLTTHVIHL